MGYAFGVLYPQFVVGESPKFLMRTFHGRRNGKYIGFSTENCKTEELNMKNATCLTLN